MSAHDGREMRAAKADASSHRATQDAETRERLRRIRTLDPDLPFPLVAQRLRISPEKARRLSREMGLPKPRQGMEP